MAQAPKELLDIVDKMSVKGQLWFWAFLKSRDATSAAVIAGYEEKSARKQGHRLLTSPRVKRALDVHTSELVVTTGVTPERVIIELARIAFLDLSNAITVTDEDGSRGINFDLLDDEQLRCLSEITTDTNTRYDKDGTATGSTVKRKIKMYDKMKALDMLARHFGLYAESGGRDIDDLRKLIDAARKRRDTDIEMVDVTPSKE